ncbi:MAG TPA: hypothetical protein VKK79_18100 [Candidatus Lokiarchaeia archaeon]|nr:hypothetical protein [Candidatus Lokiarchaeia archaeon]
MLQAIYVIDRNNGICLAGYEIVQQVQSGDIMAGFFLSALEFANVQFNCSIEQINAEEKVIVFHEGDTLVLAGIIEKTDSPRAARMFLEDIERDFLSQYRQHVENYRGNVTEFRSFDPRKTLENLVYQRIIEESLAVL